MSTGETRLLLGLANGDLLNLLDDLGDGVLDGLDDRLGLLGAVGGWGGRGGIFGVELLNFLLGFGDVLFSLVSVLLKA
jgi:hypothetical protein